jgi:hypothetical protein
MTKDPTEEEKWLLGYRGEATPVFNHTGKIVAHLPRADDRAAVLRGDMDGDGKPEAVLRMRQSGIETYRAYGHMGTRFGSYKLDAEDHCPLVGDLNGDGRDEFINFELGTITAYAKGGKRKEYPGWPSDVLPVACADLNGDKRDEVIGINSRLAYLEELSPGFIPNAGQIDDLVKKKKADAERRKLMQPKGGYLDPKSGKWTDFVFPQHLDYRCNVFEAQADEVAVGDFNADGKREVVVRPWIGTALIVFGRDGKPQYYEEFGEGATDHGVVRRGKQDYLVLQTETRLLIYP